MNVILLIALIVLGLAVIVLNEGEAFSPPMMMVGGFLICTVVLIAEQSNWSYEISSKTLFLITTSCLVFIIGDVIANYTSIDHGRTIKSRINHPGAIYSDGFFPVKQNLFFVILGIVFTVLVVIVQMRYFLRISSIIGNTQGLLGAFSVGGYIRSYVTHESIDRSTIEILLTKTALPISYVSLFLFFYNKTSKYRVKYNALLIIPIVLYAVSEVFTTNRIGLIYIGVFIITCSICVSQIRKQWSKNTVNKRFMKISLISILLIFLIFRISGYATQRGLDRTMFDQISDYTGAAIVAFDLRVKSNMFDITDAPSLFNGILRITNRFGFTSAHFMDSNAPFVFWKNGSTNIYTAICAYISAIGYTGNYLVFFLMGIIYRLLLKRIKLEGNPSDVIVFSWLLFAPALSCIAERFFTQIIIASAFIQIIEIKILTQWVINKRIEFE